MYAGNEYHLIVEAEDRNGWRDLDYIKIELTNDRDDLTVYYFPRNETAWTDSPHITIVPEGEDPTATIVAYGRRLSCQSIYR